MTPPKFFLLILFFSFSLNSAVSQNLSNWNRIPYPIASSVRSFAESSDHIYYAASTAGVFKSKDRGNTWEEAGLNEHFIDEVFVTNKGTVLAGTYRSGMFRSADGGKKWKPVGFEKNVYIFNILQDENKNLFATASFVGNGFDRGTPAGVFKSTDDGLTWTPTTMQMEAIFGISNPKPGMLFAFGKAGFYISKDKGESWTKIENRILDSIPVSSVVAHKNSLYASVGNRQDASGQYGGGIFRSDDEGKTWTRTDNGIDPKTKVNNIISFDNQLFVSTGIPYGSGSQGIYKSSDDGKTWTFAGVDHVTRFIKVTSENVLIAGTNGDCFYLSNDKGANWKQVGNGIDNWDAFNIYKRDQNFYVSDQVGRIWKGKNNEWSKIGKGIVCVLPSGRLLTFENNQIMTSDDQGDTWKNVYELQRTMIFFKYLNDTLVIAGTNEGIFYSKDQGNTWAQYNTGLDDAAFRTGVITPTGTIVTGYMKGNDAALLRSTDNGKTWDKVFRDLWAWSLIYHKGKIYAANFGRGVLVSSDDGKTWQAINEGLIQDGEYTTVTSIIAVNDTTLLCATLGKGVFRSRDNGRTWKKYNTGLTNLFAWNIFIDEKGIIYTTTQKGIFKRKEE